MSIVRVNYALITILTFSALLLSSCGSTPPAIPDAADAQEGLTTDWPTALPADHVQPWEELNAQGYVVPSDREYFGDKGTSAINALSEFVPGVEYETVAGDTSALGEGLRLTSGAVGSGTLSCATYRLTLGGVQPGVVSADVNVRPRSDDSASTYWIGLSDYGAGKWQWHGPFGDSHVRLSTTEPGADYLSPLGNMFVCVVAHDSAAVDVVGIGANVRETADTTPPDTPVGLVATPYAGVLALQWHHVTAADLAGYRVYWAKQSFSDPSTWYVQNEPYLEGANWHMLPTTPERTYVCVTAVDISGNESAASEVVSASPLADEPPVVQVTTDVLSGMRGTQVTLTATGAELYDWDLNGDGIAEVTGDTTGTGIWTFDAMGLWRPMVKGVSSDGTKAACAAVSLIITGNTRPVASATASPQSGIAPLSVTFTGTAEDGENEPSELTYAWDFDGDGVYELDTNTLTPAAEEYTAVGTYGVKFRVTDTQGAWDVDTIPVQVLPAPDPANQPPTADLSGSTDNGNPPLQVNYDAGASTDSDGTIVEYAWDFTGDGGYTLITDTPTYTYEYTIPGLYICKVRVEDDDGARTTDTFQVTVNTVGNELPVADFDATPTSGDAPLSVDFDAESSYDPDGTIVRYDWDFDGDGNYEVYDGGAEPTYNFTGPGIYSVYLRVTDDDGAQDSDTLDITVNAPGNTAPTANVAATPTSGDVPLDVDFDASTSSDPDGSIVRYDWDLDGDGNYEIYDGGDTPSWTYNSAGVYTAKVRVTDDDGAQGTDTVTITVNVPGNTAPTAAVTADPDYGETPLEVDFDATSSSDPDGTIVRYDWDFDGDGNYELYDGGSAPTWTYNTYGSYTAKVKVTDDDGAQDADTVEVSAYSWDTVTVDTTGNVGQHTSLAQVNGNPAISYFRGGAASDLKYVRASDASGTAWDAPVTMDSAGNVGKYTSLCVVNNNPAISYFDDTNDDLKYVRASDTSGTAWNAPVTVDSTGNQGQYTSLCVVNGNPAISYFDDTNNDLMYVRASDASGTAWNSPVAVDTAGDVGWDTSLCVVNGNPAISYYSASGGNLKYVRASDASGTAWNAPVGVDTGGNVGWYTSLCVVSGNPAISYYDESNNDLKYVRASDVSGSTWNTPVTVDSTGSVGQHSSLCVVNGNPAISYYDDTNDDLKYVRASDTSGTAWNTPQTLDSSGDKGEYTSMIAIGGQPFISYFADSSDNLWFAVGSFPD